MHAFKTFQAILFRARRPRPPFAAAVEDASGAEETAAEETAVEETAAGVLPAFFLPPLPERGASVAEAAGALDDAAVPVAAAAELEAAPLTGGTSFTLAVAEASADAVADTSAEAVADTSAEAVADTSAEAVAEMASDAAGEACASSAAGATFFPPAAPAKGLPSAVTVK